MLRGGWKTAAARSCARCVLNSIPGGSDPDSACLDGGVLVNPHHSDTFTRGRFSETEAPGPQDLVGVLKGPGWRKPPWRQDLISPAGGLVSFPALSHERGLEIGTLVSLCGYRSTELIGLIE